MSESLDELVWHAVHREWDPIGIGPTAEELGEYDYYVPALCQLLREGASEDVLLSTLWRIETEYMGLKGDRSATEQFARRLSALRDT